MGGLLTLYDFPTPKSRARLLSEPGLSNYKLPITNYYLPAYASTFCAASNPLRSAS
jgi:hypothetical protein